MEKALLKTLGKMIYGIYIVTSFYKKKVGGMVASWVSQVSYDPPLIMVTVHPNRFSHHLIDQSGYFALHLLSRNQTDVLERFKGPDPTAKFSSISWYRGKMGCPILASCLAYMECEVKVRYRPGNHTLFVGEVIDARFISDKETLSTFDYAGVYLGRH